MAQHDYKYKLMGTKRLGSVTSALGQYSSNTQEKILQRFIQDLTTDKDKLFKHDIEDEDLKVFMNRIKGKAFYKALKSCDDVAKSYPNLIGEIFAEYNYKGSRQLAGQFFTPQQIADDLKIFGAEYDSIFDPCAGVGALLLGDDLLSDTGVRYADDLLWVQYWYNLNALYHGTSFTPYDGSIVDLMLLNPPFNTKVFDDEGKEKDGVMHFLELASSKANKLLLIMPISFEEGGRTYKKAYEYFEENFNILGRKAIESDAFSWYETKINAMVLYCENKTQRTRAVSEVQTETPYYKKQYSPIGWETMGIKELKEIRLIVLEDLENAHQEVNKNTIKDKKVFDKKVEIGLEIADDLLKIDKLLEKAPFVKIFADHGTLFDNVV